MKDIDFDELDKAVNSLMSKGAQKETPSTPATPPVEKTDMPLTAAPVSPGTIKPKSEVATNPDAQPAITPQPTSSVALSQPATRTGMGMPANRRGGRFMDVVPKKPVAPMRPAQRQTAEPESRPIAAPSMSPAMALATPQPELTRETPPVAEKTAPVNEWPDPIDMHTAKQATSVTEDSSKETKPEKPVEKADQPLTSPFLPDAKVEKRPLGSPSPLTPMIAPEHEVMTPTPDDSQAQLPAKPSDIASEPPEEFNDDLMKVEADTHMGVPKTDESHPLGHTVDQESVEVTQESETPELSVEGEEKDTASHEPKLEKEEQKAEETPSEPSTERISIPQQYKEQPSSGEATSGAIYDTDTYHQPLAHPAKKSSGWWWVLWIFLILVVGVGAGVALYFLGIM